MPQTVVIHWTGAQYEAIATYEAAEASTSHGEKVTGIDGRMKRGNKRRKSKVSGRVFHCTNRQCGFTWHRDAVGAINIRQKYLGCGPVVGDMAPPIGIRYTPRAGAAQKEQRLF